MNFLPHSKTLNTIIMVPIVVTKIIGKTLKNTKKKRRTLYETSYHDIHLQPEANEGAIRSRAVLD